jgi:hypothetical protein
VLSHWGTAVKKSISDPKTRTVEERLNEFVVVVVKVAHERAECRIESELRRREAEQVRLAEQRKRELEAARLAAWRRRRTAGDGAEHLLSRMRPFELT